ncbi:MAG TPA: polyhydroxyalkanoic acid system family protein [Gemmataceae bacterium]|nr:polyhydroxyalkanoic acid system family protein [Gemmataceae bacterium]
MPNLTASIPHQLGRAEAKRRIQTEVGNLRTHQGALFTHIGEKWTGDKLDFSLVAMGQTISGHLLVEDKMIHLDVALPWFLQMLAGTMKQKIEQRGQHLLGGPADKK